MPPAESAEVIVLDASVAVRWVVTEAGSDEAAALLDREVVWLAPRLLLTEAASALRRKAVAGAFEAAMAVQALDVLLQGVTDGVIRLVDDEALASQALILALTLEHKVPDCVSLALAEREGAAIATADGRLARLAGSRGVTVHRVPIRK